MLREITVLRQLSQMDGGMFAPKLYDLVVPENYLERVQDAPYLFLVMEFFPNDLKQFI